MCGVERYGNDFAVDGFCNKLIGVFFFLLSMADLSTGR